MAGSSLLSDNLITFTRSSQMPLSQTLLEAGEPDVAVGFGHAEDASPFVFVAVSDVPSSRRQRICVSRVAWRRTFPATKPAEYTPQPSRHFLKGPAIVPDMWLYTGQS
jgi:hypothetical protein